MNIKNKLILEHPRTWTNFEMCTKDFESVKTKKLHSEKFYTFKVNHLDVDYIEPYMIYIIFVQFLDFEHTFKPMEKVLYEIPFQYQDYHCMFSMEKFGLKFIINSEEEVVIKTILKKIKSASKLAERLLKPVITESIDNGDITIENHSGILRRRYFYFRETTDQIFSDYKDGIFRDSGSMVKGINRKIKLEEKIIFNSKRQIKHTYET